MNAPVTSTAIVPVTREPWPADRHGQDEKTALNMAKYIAVGAHSPGIRARMAEALDAAGIARAARPSVRRCAEAARAWVIANVRYASDPLLAELIQDPRITACTDDAPGGACVPLEDCDGHAVLVLSMLASVGVEVCVYLLDYGPGRQPHVLGGVKDESGQWLDVDTTTSRGVGEHAWAAHRRRINPFDPKVAPLGYARAEYVGVGKALDIRPVSVGEAIFGRGVVGAGAPIVVTPDDVLAFRVLWEPYVKATIDRIDTCAQAIDAALAKGSYDAATVDVYKRIAANLHAAAGSAQKQGQLAADWNAFAGLTPEQIVAGGSYILRGQQKTVAAVNDARNFCIAVGCKSPPPWPGPPAVDLQKQLAARVEGLKLLAAGTFGIFVETVDDTVNLVAGQVAWWQRLLSSPWLWLAVSLAAVSSVALVYSPEIKALLPHRKAA